MVLKMLEKKENIVKEKNETDVFSHSACWVVRESLERLQDQHVPRDTR